MTTDPVQPAAPAPAQELSLHGLGVGFGRRVVLASLTLALPAHGVDVLMGPVHSGKSTLFKTLAGDFEGHALHRQWGEARLGELPIEGRHRPLLVAQHVRLLNLPVWQVLRQPLMERGAVPARSPTEWQAWAAQQLQAHALPLPPAALSGSLMALDRLPQRQVLILAHALAAREGSGWLLIDEPCFDLAPDQAQGMVAWLRSLGQGLRLWVSLHHQQQARQLADRITLMGGGYIQAHQPTEAFFTQPANEAVLQFLRSGSLSLPAPDARAEDLADDVLPPPPLPPEALRQLHAPPPPPSAAASAATATPAPLPKPSRDGVALASAVGQVTLSNGQGPNGFRWIVPGLLAGSPAPGVVHDLHYDLDLLARAGITHLITLTETDLDTHALRRHGLSNTHLSVFDGHTPSVRQMHLLLVLMQRLIQRQEVLAVHCKAGLGRTGLVLACWMIWEGGLGADAALQRLRRVNPGYVQTAEQEAFLQRFEQDILQRLN